MEASTLVRSSSFHSRSGSFNNRRSASVAKLASPRFMKVRMAFRDNMELGSQLRRARSEADLIGSRSGSGSLLPVPFVEDEKDAMTELNWQAFTVQGMVTKEETDEEMEEESELFGSGIGKGGNFTGGGKGGQGSSDQSENSQIHDRYVELLKSDPANPLLLRNYGKFLYEVEGDVKGAEECYGRAMLASPGDGEVLMLYGMLVWENYKEKERAGAYLQRATKVSPNDCVVLAAYAKFLWEVSDDEDDDITSESMAMPFQPLVAAF